LYALLLRNIVDAATGQNFAEFWKGIVLTALLVLAQLALGAVIRWLTELSKSTIENLFKARLMGSLLKKDYLRISAIHSGEWLNRLTADTNVVVSATTQIVPGLSGMAVRMIGALAVLLTLTGGRIGGTQAVRKSFPDFFEKLQMLGIEITSEETD